MKNRAQFAQGFIKLQAFEAIHSQLNHIGHFGGACDGRVKLARVLDANGNTDSRALNLFHQRRREAMLALRVNASPLLE
jgi:hypothetical protein